MLLSENVLKMMELHCKVNKFVTSSMWTYDKSLNLVIPARTNDLKFFKSNFILSLVLVTIIGLQTFWLRTYASIPILGQCIHFFFAFSSHLWFARENRRNRYDVSLLINGMISFEKQRNGIFS